VNISEGVGRGANQQYRKGELSAGRWKRTRPHSSPAGGELSSEKRGKRDAPKTGGGHESTGVRNNLDPFPGKSVRTRSLEIGGGGQRKWMNGRGNWQKTGDLSKTSRREQGTRRTRKAGEQIRMGKGLFQRRRLPGRKPTRRRWWRRGGYQKVTRGGETSQRTEKKGVGTSSIRALYTAAIE